jgi:uncharacterized membrane protein (DUF2068 family)
LSSAIGKAGSPALTKRLTNRQLEAGTMPTSTHDNPEIVEQPAGVAAPADNHAGGLLVVGLFKLSKAVFFTAVGAGALHLLHKNVADVLMRIVETLKLDQEHRLVVFLLGKATVINSHELREAGTLSFLYAAVCVVEGTGLVLRKGWAEYFTVTLTALGLPWESYELMDKFSMYKVALLVLNLAVLLYLLWVLKRKREDGDA